jgi:hypothetical protein
MDISARSIHILPYDIIRLILRKNLNFHDLTNARMVCNDFKNAINLFKLKQAQLEDSLRNIGNIGNHKRYCVNEDCFWDSYLDLYISDHRFIKYIHSHQYAVNTAHICSDNSPPKKIWINIPYCYECMQEYIPYIKKNIDKILVNKNYTKRLAAIYS